MEDEAADDDYDYDYEETDEERRCADGACPLDLSFKRLTVCRELPQEKPRASRVGVPPRCARSMRFLTRSLWLDNNLLPSTSGIDLLAESLLQAPHRLAWLDISYNEISQVEESLLQLRGLRILYLHANRIDSRDVAGRLGGLPLLHTLTLYGNPLQDSTPWYRLFFIAALPRLVKLDRQPIHASERADAAQLFGQ